MDKILNVILIIVIVILILLDIIIVYNRVIYPKNDNKKFLEEFNQWVKEMYGENEIVLEEAVQEIKSSQFYTVVNCIYKYFEIINVNNSSYYEFNENGQNIKNITDSEINQRILKILSNEYIEDNNITYENIRDYVEITEENLIFIPVNMNVKKVYNMEKYLIKGFTTDLENNFKEELYIIVNLDVSNKTFSIEPIMDSKKTIQEIEIVSENRNILKNEENEYKDEFVDDEYIAKKYISSFKSMLLANPSIAYNYLDVEYREKRFKNEEELKQYVYNNRSFIKGIRLSKYSVMNDGRNKKYICIDQYKNYYVFNETAIMQYTVMLDTYTLDLPEFLEQYNSTNNQGKTALNIQKFFQAINAKDYSYAYSKLADSFKNNYFKTEQEFEEYIKNNFFSYNEVEYGEFSVGGDVNVYKLILTDQTGNNTNKLSLNIIMQLGEGTDFVMSFGT